MLHQGPLCLCSEDTVGYRATGLPILLLRVEGCLLLGDPCWPTHWLAPPHGSFSLSRAHTKKGKKLSKNSCRPHSHRVAPGTVPAVFTTLLRRLAEDPWLPAVAQVSPEQQQPPPWGETRLSKCPETRVCV